MRCQRRSRIELGEGVVLLAELDDGIPIRSSWERNLTVVLVDKDVDMDCESVIRNGASKDVAER